jgi:hypothetical protein
MSLLNVSRLLSNAAAHPALILGVSALALHLWASAGYDYFSDELYFIVCGQHVAWGYVDQPPLTPLIAGLAHGLFGNSLVGLRLVPTLTAAALVALTTEAARRLGGGFFARWLCGLAVLLAPVFLGVAQTLSTDSLQPLAWLAATLALISAIESERSLPWYVLGAIAGVAFLDKYAIAFFLIAAAGGIVLTPERRVLARVAPWLSTLLFLLIVTPNLLWQRAHGWPFLELNSWAIANRNIAYEPLGYLVQQVILLGPLSSPIWLAGLAGFAFWQRFAAQRWIAIAWILLMAMMLLTHGKSYYPAGIYPILLAGGAVVIELLLQRASFRAALATGVLVAGVALLPFVTPALPLETFLSYQGAFNRVTGLNRGTAALDRQALGRLPANYASMFGYREIVAAVGRAYQALPAKDKAKAVFFGRSYAEAAAIDVLSGSKPMPLAISGHNNYFLWGPHGHDGSVVLLLSTAPRPDLLATFGAIAPVARVADNRTVRDELLKTFTSAQPVARIDNPFAQPFERNLTLWLCRGPKVPMDWQSLKHYD